MMFAHSLLLVLVVAFANSGQAQNVFDEEEANATTLKTYTAANAPVVRASTKQLRGKAGKNVFEYGVASGDPLDTSVIIWTAVNDPSAALQVQLKWEMSTNVSFNPIVASGTVNALLANDFTAKVDVTGLSAGTQYWYRFKLATGSMTSPVGRTRTLPENGVDEVKLAVFSCTNYPAGYFHAYEDAVQRGAEFALHLGDYIYEYGADGFASGNA
jgi:alkaline phosphatase D